MYHLNLALDEDDENILTNLSNKLGMPKSKVVRKALAMYNREPVFAIDPTLRLMRPQHCHTLGYAFPYCANYLQSTDTFLQIDVPEGRITIERDSDGMDISIWPYEFEPDDDTEPVTAVYVEYDDMLELWRKNREGK